MSPREAGDKEEPSLVKLGEGHGRRAEVANLGSKAKPTAATARPPGPVQPPPLAVPADPGLRPDDGKVLTPPSGPQVKEPDPEDVVGLAQARAGWS